uniref:Uncharacterized protein n=1 Tax=Arundo donax TaxID=35708 RepID=A0A0A9BPP2_ARUDO
MGLLKVPKFRGRRRPNPKVQGGCLDFNQLIVNRKFDSRRKDIV